MKKKDNEHQRNDKLKKCVIIPYFGKFPNYFYAWYISASMNPDFTFLIFTDCDTDLKETQNIKFFHVSFSFIQNLIKEKVGDFCVLKSAYKLCDYKPAFGLIFEDYIRDYSFWGYGDLDLVYGNIGAFLTDEVFSSYDKILTLGHLSFLKNSTYTNNLFKTNLYNGEISYPFCYMRNQIFFFDEVYFNDILSYKKVRVYKNKSYEDIIWKKFDFFTTNHANMARFRWDNGHLFLIQKHNDVIEKKEVLYCHFQKRHMNFTPFNKHFILYPNAIKGGSNIDDEKLLLLKDTVNEIKYEKSEKKKIKIRAIKRYIPFHFYRLWLRLWKKI